MDDDPQVWQITTDIGVLGGVLVGACPHCAEPDDFEALVGVATEIDEDGRAHDLSSVCCLCCGASGPLVKGGMPGAVAAWNHRAPARVMPQRRAN